jgi:hypothetical protein
LGDVFQVGPARLTGPALSRWMRRCKYKIEKEKGPIAPRISPALECLCSASDEPCSLGRDGLCFLGESPRPRFTQRSVRSASRSTIHPHPPAVGFSRLDGPSRLANSTFPPTSLSPATPDASLSAGAAQLAGLEPPIAQRLVRDTADRLGAVLDFLPPSVASWFRGYQVRILDGNVLKNTPHRLKVLRPTRASALAGLSVLVLDPERSLAIDWFPSENGHDQERSRIPKILQTVPPHQVWIGDRNFCTTQFLAGLIERDSCFLIR